MSRDEFGMPVPDEELPLPWEPDGQWDVLDKNGLIVVYDCSTEKSRDFIAHAANNIIPAREIVRRLAEATVKEVNPSESYKRIAYDAANLWARMQKEVGDGT